MSLITSESETKEITQVVVETIPTMTKKLFKVLGMKYTGKHKKQYQAFNCHIFSKIYKTIYKDLKRFED